MKTLTYVATTMVDDLTWPVSNANTTLHSNALSVFTDFEKTGPRVIEANTLADSLVDLMKKEHVRMKIVVDKSNQFVGIVSLEDLSEDAFIKQVAHGYKRSDLFVSDMMRSKEDLLAVSYSSLKKSDIESLLFSQRHSKYQHLLVIDERTKAIRGVISSNDIARVLRLDVDISFSNFMHAYNVAVLGHNGKMAQRQVA